MTGGVEVHDLRPGELSPAELRRLAGLHERELADQFVAQFGQRFLRHYHRAFASTEGGLALVARDSGTGEVAGLLLGSTHPAAFYPLLLRRHGLALGLQLLCTVAARPRFGVRLLRTRGARYLRGVRRLVLRRPVGRTGAPARSGGAPAEATAEVTAEVTVVVVDAQARGRGVGRALLERAEEQVRAAGVQRIELVTLQDPGGAAAFYERLGWQRCGEV
ncbi:MAG: GNAT family N-acetyltransferase, partial [Mycobacteriales bacterium]